MVSLSINMGVNCQESHLLEDVDVTFRDLLLLVRHYGKLSIALVLAGALLGGVFYCCKSYSGGAYTAKATLSMAEPTSTIPSSELMPLVGSTALGVAQELSFDGVSVEVEYDLATRTVEFSSRGADGEEVVSAVNTAVNLTAERTLEFFRELGDSYGDAGLSQDNSSDVATEALVLQFDVEGKALAFQTIAASVNEAVAATPAFGISGLVKYFLAGLFGGALLAVVAVVLITLRNTPVKSRRDLEEACPTVFITEVSKTTDVARLWANIEFTRGGSDGRLCLLPIASAEPAALGCALAQCASARGSSADSISLGSMESHLVDAETLFVVCPPFEQNTEALYEAHRADGVVLCVRQWDDRVSDVERVVQELSVAHADLVGIAFIVGRLS